MPLCMLLAWAASVRPGQWGGRGRGAACRWLLLAAARSPAAHGLAAAWSDHEAGAGARRGGGSCGSKQQAASSEPAAAACPALLHAPQSYLCCLVLVFCRAAPSRSCELRAACTRLCPTPAALACGPSRRRGGRGGRRTRSAARPSRKPCRPIGARSRDVSSKKPAPFRSRAPHSGAQASPRRNFGLGRGL